jgi:LPS export ABC transporter protein LptC
MGRNSGKIFILLAVAILAYGCSRKPENEQPAEEPREEITGFSLKQFADDKTSFVLKGETAEIASDSGTAVAGPELSFQTATEVIEITTGGEGRGEVNLNPDEKRVRNVTITGNVRIVYRDIKTGAVTMEGRCGKLTYNDAEKTIVMEKSPVITRNKSNFKGDVIYYHLEKNTLELKGNVNARIYGEEKTSD